MDKNGNIVEVEEEVAMDSLPAGVQEGLRKAAGARKMIIAAATGYGLASDRLRSQAAGFDHHLVKPIDADFLLNFVAQQFASY